MKHEQRKDLGRHPLPFSAFLAYLVVCTFLLTGVSFSKYVTRSNAADSARVAKGIVTVGYTGSTVVEIREEDAIYDMGFDYFKFDVSNEDSEVAIGYDIVVTLDRPLQSGVMMIWKDGVPAEEFATVTDGGKKYTFSNAGTFEAGGQQTHEHTLGFSVNFASVPGVGTYIYDIDISIESHQID